MRPRRTRRSVTRARCPPRKITGEFSTRAHWIAPAMLAMPGPSVPMHSPGLPVIREAASAMKPALNSWCGATTDHPRASASVNMCTKFGSGIPKMVLMPSASNRSRIRLYTGTAIVIVSSSRNAVPVARCAAGDPNSERLRAARLRTTMQAALPVSDAAVQLDGLADDLDRAADAGSGHQGGRVRVTRGDRLDGVGDQACRPRDQHVGAGVFDRRRRAGRTGGEWPPASPRRVRTVAGHRQPGAVDQRRPPVVGERPHPRRPHRDVFSTVAASGLVGHRLCPHIDGRGRHPDQHHPAFGRRGCQQQFVGAHRVGHEIGSPAGPFRRRSGIGGRIDLGGQRRVRISPVAIPSRARHGTGWAAAQ